MPTRPQFDFSRAIGEIPETKDKIFLVTSANGTGKTSGVIVALANIIWPGFSMFRYAKDMQTGEKFDGFYSGPLYQKWPAEWPKKIWVVGHSDGLQELVDELRKWWPKQGYAYKENKDGKTFVARIVTKNGWTILFKTTNQEKRAFESGNVGIVWFDEPPTKWQYDAAIWRVRKGGFILVTATPVFEAAWFADSIIDKVQRDGDKKHFTVNVFSNSIEPTLNYRSGKQECGGEWDLGVYGIHPKGNLRADQVQFMIDNCDEEEKPARIFGEMTHLAGLVYKLYCKPERARHYRDLSWDHERPWYQYRFIIDPHDRLPPAMAWCRLEPNGRRYYFREWPSPDDRHPDGTALFDGKMFWQIKDAGIMTIADYVKCIIDIEEELRIPLDRIQRIMDPNFAKQRMSSSGREVWQEYIYQSRLEYKRRRIYEQGTAFRFVLNVRDEIEPGHAKVRTLLKYDRLVVSPDCPNIDLTLRRYSYDEHKVGKTSEGKEPKQGVKTLHKHFADDLRYEAQLEFKYKPYARGWSGEGMDYPRSDWRKRYAKVQTIDGVERPKGVGR